MLPVAQLRQWIDGQAQASALEIGVAGWKQTDDGGAYLGLTIPEDGARYLALGVRSVRHASPGEPSDGGNR